MATQSKPIRVMHFGLGPIGSEITRVAASRSGVDVVGAVDIDPDKAGLAERVDFSIGEDITLGGQPTIRVDRVWPTAPEAPHPLHGTTYRDMRAAYRAGFEGGLFAVEETVRVHYAPEVDPPYEDDYVASERECADEAERVLGWRW